jgi:8-oxo-dGTP pyrophosphatase MutT (NUDIX family)
VTGAQATVTSSAPDIEIVALDRVEIALEPWPWRFALERRAEIDRHFAQILRERSGVWNGRILLLNRYAICDGALRGACFETDFASLCAWRDWEFPDRSVYNIYAAAALRGANGGFLVGQMAPGTANAGMLYFPCGTPEPHDVAAGGGLDLAGNLARELLEETGLAIGACRCESGWTLVRDGCYLGVLKLVTAPQPAEELRARILHYIGGEKRPEFTDIRILRSCADFHPSMPRFVPAYLRDFWSRHPLSAR